MTDGLGYHCQGLIPPEDENKERRIQMSEDIIQVMRVLIYKGPRSWVEKTLSESIKGTKKIVLAGIGSASISAATIHEFPEILREKSNATD